MPEEESDKRHQVIVSSRLRGHIRVIESWYDEDPESFDDFDLWICHQRSKAISPDSWLYFYTIHVDLTLSPRDLLTNMRKNTSREIRQADEKDGVTLRINTSPTREDLEAYAAIYNGNPRSASQAPLGMEKLLMLRKAGRVHLSEVRSAEGETLAVHCLYYHEASQTIQLSSMVSLHRQCPEKSKGALVARANRWLFYEEFLFYKEQGCTIYDLNGWYAGLEDGKRLAINQFKEGFRGRLLYGYDCEKALTRKGHLYLLLKRIQWTLFDRARLKDRSRRRRKAPAVPDL